MYECLPVRARVTAISHLSPGSLMVRGRVAVTRSGTTTTQQPQGNLTYRRLAEEPPVRRRSSLIEYRHLPLIRPISPRLRKPNMNPQRARAFCLRSVFHTGIPVGLLTTQFVFCFLFFQGRLRTTTSYATQWVKEVLLVEH